MNLRLAAHAPFPWLNIITGIIFGRKKSLTNPAKSPRRRGFKFPRSLSITKEGKWYIAVLIAIGIGAINTGNNLLYLVVAVMLSFIVISGIMSESTLKGVTVSRKLPSRAFKGAPAHVQLKVKNYKKILPSFSFTIAEIPITGLKTIDAYFLKVAEHGEAVKNILYTFENRGQYVLEGVKIITRFPFGLFIKSKEETASDELIIYPSINSPLKRALITAGEPQGRGQTRKKGKGVELYNLRDYTVGDDARHIYWKSAARTQKLLLKEFEIENEKKVMVVFDNYTAADATAFEHTVDEAASAINHFISLGFSVGLKTLGAELQPKTGRPQLYAALKILALISPVASKGAGKCSVRVQSA